MENSQKLTVTQNGIVIQLKSLAEIRFKSPSLKSCPKNQKTTLILNLISKTYFKCGQKTSQEEITALTSAFIEEMEDYQHITIFELENVFKNGYKQVYGEYFGLNVKTFITWVDYYNKNIRNQELSKLREEKSLSEIPKKETTEKEKQYWINRGVSECVEHYEKTFTIMDGKLYVYEILYDLGMLPNDNEYKKKKYNEAKEVIEFEISSTKNKSLSHKKKMDEILKEIQLPKSGKLINKAKELILLEFFRVLTKDEVKLEEFKQRFKN